MNEVQFEQLGYFKEYWQDNKFVGIVTGIEKDRETIGYEGRKVETLANVVICTNKKKLKLGQEVTTLLYPLNGKVVKNG